MSPRGRPLVKRGLFIDITINKKLYTDLVRCADVFTTIQYKVSELKNEEVLFHYSPGFIQWTLKYFVDSLRECLQCRMRYHCIMLHELRFDTWTSQGSIKIELRTQSVARARNCTEDIIYWNKEQFF